MIFEDVYKRDLSVTDKSDLYSPMSALKLTCSVSLPLSEFVHYAHCAGENILLSAFPCNSHDF